METLGIINGNIYVDGRFEKTDILIENDKIQTVGKFPKSKADTIIDASKKLVIPGLVNTHTHVAMTLFRGLGEDLPLHRWLTEKIWPLESKQTPKQIKLASELAFCEMIRSGTTSFAEMCLFDTKPVFDAAAKFGIRGVISRGALDNFDPKSAKNLLSEIKSTISYSTSLLKTSISAHAPYTCSQEYLIKTKEIANKNSLLYQIHVSETRKEVFDIQKRTGKFPFEYLDSIGLMDENSLFVHGGWLTKREIDLAGKRKINFSTCPVSNLKLATGGIAQIFELDNAGANVTIGTDSVASNNSLNMFESIKFASLLQKHHYWKADIMKSSKFVDFATSNGAKAIGFDCGTISAGKLADLVLLEKTVNLIPSNDNVSNLVFSASPANVSDVIINGKQILRDRKFVSIDEASILENAENEIASFS